MKWSLWVAALVALAGCADAPNEAQENHDADEDHGDHDHGDHDGHNNTQEGDNHTQDRNASFTADVRNGTAPLAVNFTWHGNVSWSLDLDGDGEEDHTGQGAGNISHVYEAGTWNATWTAHNETFVIVITAHAPGPVEPEVLHHSEGTADFVLGISSGDPEYALQCPGFIAGDSGQGCVFFDFEALDDLPYVMASSGPAIRFAFWSACDPTSTGISGGNNAADTHGGTVPAGAGCVVIWSPATDTAGGGIDYAFTVQSF